jgi:hypothetical protein
LRRGENAVPALLLLGAVPLLARFARHALPFFALAAAFIARSIATTGWLYEYYTALGFLSLAIMLVEVAACSLGASFRMRTWQSAALTGYLGLSVASALFLVSSQLPALRESDRHATVDHRMWLRRYWTAGDRAAIAGYLRAAAKQPGGPHRVYFVPEADALLFEDLRNPNLSFVQPTQCTYRPADIVILHESPWTRAHVTTMGLVSTGVKHGIEAPLDKWQVLRSRVGGERWLAYPPLPVQAAQARQNLL